MLVLASASPRRRELLGRAGLSFVVVPAGVDESVPRGTRPDEAAREIARRKACAVAASRTAGDFVLGADTVVALLEESGWRLLGKPAHAQEAKAMLGALSCTRHAVVTGVCAVAAPAGAPVSASETTWVTMRPIGALEIEAYAASGEWCDKAGGYALQESADRFVTSLEGGFDNVVGLPVSLALDVLARAGWRRD
jgi:septum formation protein